MSKISECISFVTGTHALSLHLLLMNPNVGGNCRYYKKTPNTSSDLIHLQAVLRTIERFNQPTWITPAFDNGLHYWAKYKVETIDGWYDYHTKKKLFNFCSDVRIEKHQKSFEVRFLNELQSIHSFLIPVANECLYCLHALRLLCTRTLGLQLNQNQKWNSTENCYRSVFINCSN